MRCFIQKFYAYVLRSASKFICDTAIHISVFAFCHFSTTVARMPPKKVDLDLTPTKRKALQVGAIKATPPISFLIMTATIGGYYAADFRHYPGKIKEELEKAVGADGENQLRYTFGLQKAVMPNDKSSYVLFWEDDMSDNEDNKEPKDFVLIIFKILEVAQIDGTRGFKISTDIPFAKTLCEDYGYHLSEMALATEKNKIDSIVRERWTIQIEFTIVEDDITVVLTNAWRFRKKRMQPLSLDLIKQSALQRVTASEPAADGEQKDPWVHAGTIKRSEFDQWIQDAQGIFRSMPVHFILHIPDENEEANIRALLRSTNWTGFGA